jgi:hypothetical protein
MLTLLVPNTFGSSLAFKAPSPRVGRVAVKVMIFPPIVPCKPSNRVLASPTYQPDIGSILTISL